MSKPGLQRVEELFHQALTLDPKARAEFLKTECHGQKDLRDAVENLLRHDADTLATDDQFLAGPLARSASQLRGDATVPSRRSASGGPDVPHDWPAIAGYEILGELGRGGMGVVYKARHLALNRIVALKMLLPSVLDGPEQLNRFRSEAEMLARIQHPNIIPIFDIGEHEGHPYFTMEFVDGPSLSQCLASKPQDVMASARFIEVLARAIQIVHAAGVIHRDLKPANVLLKPEKSEVPATIAETLRSATPKITDFGVAKDQGAGRGLSQTGVTLGTPSYMAPEQVRNRANEVGPATDIYALGAMLYEMLTGRPPFDAGTPVETVAQVLTEDPIPPARLRPRLPRDLTTICLKCLEKAPTERFASASELADDLRRFQAGEPIKARPVSPIEHALRWSRRHKLAATLAGLCALLFAALITAVLLYNSRLQAALALANDRVADQQQQIVQLNIDIGMRSSEAGDHFAAVLRYSEALRLDDGSANDLRDRIVAALASCPRLAQLHELGRRVLCAQAVGNELRVVCEKEPSVVQVSDAYTGKRIGPEVKCDKPLRSAAVSPDGQWLAILDTDGGSRAVRIADGKATLLAPSEPIVWIGFVGNAHLVLKHQGAGYTVWARTGDRWAPLPPRADSNKLQLVHDDPRWQVELGDPSSRRRLINSATGQPIADLEQPHLVRAEHSIDESQIATVASDQAVHLQHRKTPGLKSLVHHMPGAITHLSFSRDGQHILLGDATGRVRVWSTTTGKSETPPLRHPGPLIAAHFTEAANEFVVVCRDGTVRVWHLGGEPHRIAPGQRVDSIVKLARLLANCSVAGNQELTPLSERHRQALVEHVKSEMSK